MTLFHASYEIFEVGQIYTADRITPYFLEKQTQNLKWIDLLLNEYKPDHAPIREQTFFACDSVENCHAYISSLNRPAKVPSYYKVEMENPVKCVMCLTDLLRIVGDANPNVNVYAQEYWTPTLEWKYYEYLSNEMTILEVVPEPDVVLKNRGKANYSADRELRIKTFGC
jgi:hypothetical protein